VGGLRWAKVAGAVRSSTVVVPDVLREQHTQGSLAEDQHAIGEFGSEGADGRTVSPSGLPLVVGVSAANINDGQALQPLVAGGAPIRSRRRAVGGVLPRDPPADRLHDVASLGVVERVPGGDVVPARQAGATARRGGVLRDEHGMPAVGRLTAIIARFGRGQPAPDEVLGVSADGRDAAQVDHRAVPAAQPELRAEMVLPDPVQPGVQLVHRRCPTPAPGPAFPAIPRAAPTFVPKLDAGPMARCFSGRARLLLGTG
jgi:hypothetical protein